MTTRAQVILQAALARTPRRWRMPPLPASPEAARAAGADTALAYAIEQARIAAEPATHAAPVAAGTRELFVESLAALIRTALAPSGGDPAFQALVLRASAPEVEEHVQLSAPLAADARAVRAAVDAIAHPGKLQAMAAGPARDALAHLHALASRGAWDELAAVHAAPGPALQRLTRGIELRRAPAVQRYRALVELQGPVAGTQAASEHGRAAQRAGADAEAATLRAFKQIALVLDRCDPSARHRAVHGLHVPRGFPGDALRAKNEWDAAIVRSATSDADPDADAAGDIVLLAEVKASPAAATSDFARLRRGLERMALVDAHTDHGFASPDGTVRLSGASLRMLQPAGHALPQQVIYCSTAAAEAQVPVMSAAAKGLLLTQPPCVEFALRIERTGETYPAILLPLWNALVQAPHLRSVLHQHETSRLVRGHMLHPDDLAAQVEALAA